MLGRCTLDIRVCASPSRDSNVNEKRKQKEKENSTADDKESEDPLSPPPPQSNGRKRGVYSACVWHQLLYNIGQLFVL